MLRIVPHTVPRVGRSYEQFPDGFELHLLHVLPTLALLRVVTGEACFGFRISGFGLRIQRFGFEVSGFI